MARKDTTQGFAFYIAGKEYGFSRDPGSHQQSLSTEFEDEIRQQDDLIGCLQDLLHDITHLIDEGEYSAKEILVLVVEDLQKLLKDY